MMIKLKRNLLSVLMARKCVFLLVLSSIFLISGCGQGDNSQVKTPDCYANEESETNAVEVENGAEKDVLSETYEEHTGILDVPVNNQAEEVCYLSVDGIDMLRAIHRCVSDGKNIFLAYNEPDIYIMQIGADKHSPSNIDNPDGLKVCNVTIDTYGEIHLLMAGDKYDEWYIWCLDEAYQIKKVIDISAYCETKYIPIWFLVDKDGTYYFQWPNDRKGIIVDSEGVLKHEITLETLGISWIYEAAVGKDGRMYLVYSNDGKQLEIGELDVETGSVKKDNSNLPLGENETFTAMSAGTDTNLLLFSPYSGVWAYDNEKGIVENRATLSDISLEKDMEYWPLTFLPDGRLLIVGRTVNDDSSENADLIIKYIPAGK